MDVDLTIRGLQFAQAANNARIARLQSGGPMDALVKDVTVYTHRQAVAVTHVDSGSLRASHRMKIEVRGGNPTGTIYIDPTAINPRSGQRPAAYGQIEMARGGGHAFYTIAAAAGRAYASNLVRSLTGQITQ